MFKSKELMDKLTDEELTTFRSGNFPIEFRDVIIDTNPWIGYEFHNPDTYDGAPDAGRQFACHDPSLEGLLKTYFDFCNQVKDGIFYDDHRPELGEPPLAYEEYLKIDPHP